MPTFEKYKRFIPFIEDEAPTLLKERLGIIAHPCDTPYTKKLSINDPSTLIIGPEGGFTEKGRNKGGNGSTKRGELNV